MMKKYGAVIESLLHELVATELFGYPLILKLYHKCINEHSKSLMDKILIYYSQYYNKQFAF